MRVYNSTGLLYSWGLSFCEDITSAELGHAEPGVLYWKIFAVRKVGEYDGMHLNSKSQQLELPILDRNIIFQWPIEYRIFGKLSLEGKYPMIQGKGCKLQHLQALMWLMLTDVVLGDGLELGGFAGGTHSEMFLRAFCQGEQPRNCLGFLNFLGPPNFYATATSSQLQQPTWMDSSIPAFLIFLATGPFPPWPCAGPVHLRWFGYGKNRLHGTKCIRVPWRPLEFHYLAWHILRIPAAEQWPHFPTMFFLGLYMCHGQKLDYSISPMVEDGHPLNDGDHSLKPYTIFQPWHTWMIHMISTNHFVQGFIYQEQYHTHSSFEWHRHCKAAVAAWSELHPHLWLKQWWTPRFLAVWFPSFTWSPIPFLPRIGLVGVLFAGNSVVDAKLTKLSGWDFPNQSRSLPVQMLTNALSVTSLLLLRTLCSRGSGAPVDGWKKT